MLKINKKVEYNKIYYIFFFFLLLLYIILYIIYNIKVENKRVDGGIKFFIYRST